MSQRDPMVRIRDMQDLPPLVASLARILEEER